MRSMLTTVRWLGRGWESMTVKYLFRLDLAKENDEFMRLSGFEGFAQVYSGAVIKIGSGWIPDFIEVVYDSPQSACTVTLIELEATKAAALISARKYLPEDASHILSALDSYIDRVVKQCRTRADPRLPAFAALKDFLLQADTITVFTAGALRISRRYVEKLPLMRQPYLKHVIRPVKTTTDHSIDFRGKPRLIPRDRKTLFRAVLVLDAVVRECDYSGATFKNWLNLRTQPIKVAVREAPEKYPVLDAFLRADTRSGGSVDCEGIAQELSALWSTTRELRLEGQHVSRLVERFFPVVSSLRSADPVATAFDKAKSVLGEVLSGSTPPPNARLELEKDAPLTPPSLRRWSQAPPL